MQLVYTNPCLLSSTFYFFQKKYWFFLFSMVSSLLLEKAMGEFPSGQRGQTVNLLALPSVVRIHLRPFTYLLRATVLARMRLISAIGMYEKRICRSGGTGRRPGLKIPWVVIPVPVRFRSAALVKDGRNVEFTAFLLFFCFKMFEHLWTLYD